MEITVCPDLADILKMEIGAKKGLVVVEKLAGAMPKAAIAFLRAYPNVKYTVFNLADSSDRFFEEAEKFCRELGLSLDLFRARIRYVAGVNLVKTKLSEVLGDATKVDVIIYWGAALRCLEPFEGKKEQEYLKIFEEEKQRHGIDYFERHLAVRRRHEQSTRTGLSDEALFEVLANDVGCLSSDGILVTNYEMSFEKIRLIMGALGMKFKNYEFSWSFTGDYERKITVWRKRSK